MSAPEILIKRLPLILVQDGHWQGEGRADPIMSRYRTDPRWKVEEYGIQITNALFDAGYEYPTYAELIIKLLKPE